MSDTPLLNLTTFLKKNGYNKADAEAFEGVEWYIKTYLHKNTIYDSGHESEKQKLKTLIENWFNSLKK